MHWDEWLGRTARLTLRRFGPPGAFLAPASDAERVDDPTLLLPGGEIPEGASEGDELSVCVYLDSEGRPIASMKRPRVERGEVTFLTVTACTDFGSFVDWGLPKELLVPFAEQTIDLRVGDRHPVGLYVDKGGRLAGTMRVAEMLGVAKKALALDEWVQGEAWRHDVDIGVFVILGRTQVGLLPASEPHGLKRGQAARFRVTNLLPDGKVEVSLRGHAHEELSGDAQRVLETLWRTETARGSRRRIGDRSSPDEIRAVFGLSKKAFKRAVGRLLKEGAVDVEKDGVVVPIRPQEK